MFLAIDIGNTSIEYGFFEGRTLQEVYRQKSEFVRSYDDTAISLRLFMEEHRIYKADVEDILISSVVPSLNSTLTQCCKILFDKMPSFIGPGFSSGIPIHSDNPKEVGSDLIADCALAKSLFGEPTLIVDLGTATKLILLDKNLAFSGCVIAPGIRISLTALVGKAALLNDIDIKIPNKVLGKNTVDSINSALTYGNAHALIGLANDIEKQAGYPMKRIIGGGYAEFLKSLMSDYTYIDNLTLKGIEAIYHWRKNHD